MGNSQLDGPDASCAALCDILQHDDHRSLAHHNFKRDLPDVVNIHSPDHLRKVAYLYRIIRQRYLQGPLKTAGAEKVALFISRPLNLPTADVILSLTLVWRIVHLVEVLVPSRSHFMAVSILLIKKLLVRVRTCLRAGMHVSTGLGKFSRAGFNANGGGAFWPLVCTKSGALRAVPPSWGIGDKTRPSGSLPD